MVTKKTKTNSNVKHPIAENTKETIEHIKDDAKNYYKWKKMVTRYVVIGFLFILLILQFLLPNSTGTKTSPDIDTTLNNTELQDTENKISNTDPQNKAELETKWYMFLDGALTKTDLLEVEKYIDYATTSITSDLSKLTILYRQNILFLSELAEQLQVNEIPTDFQYLTLLNDIKWPSWNLPLELAGDYWLIITDKIDERLNKSKYTQANLDYLNDLYTEFKQRDLVLVAYLIWPEQLDDIIDNQKQTTFKDLYFESDILTQYYRVLWYKATFENIWEYLDTETLVPYFQANTDIISLDETKNLIKRAKKNDYTYKEIKQLNPWILWDSLPRWDREIKVYSK